MVLQLEHLFSDTKVKLSTLSRSGCSRNFYSFINKCEESFLYDLFLLEWDRILFGIFT